MEEISQLLPLLMVASGPMRGVGFRLRRQPQVIGRDPTVDIVVRDPHLSRRHAEIRLTGEGVCVTDLGSTNGTWVNGGRASGSTRLADGDVIRLGRTELRFHDPGVARTDPVGLSFGAAQQQRPTLVLVPGGMSPRAAGTPCGVADSRA
ncbi:FHA domain-containing protein [Micromonospora endophytica]|uniref:FHA domain-containing protein n=1 Tax=Micromonospora endophytica TaxID=515350 RepID=A0A2W2CCG0_9ACTN|nr:FHA domain-containing protein [Micromonospora endophytica]PZF95400.1 FHA domain-containing protein [Micromonospora endophytica]RIW50917.1 FHA domain-containing protein [Micromonospora endophytica]